jgi:alpha-D-xyloside xylohydrolase
MRQPTVGWDAGGPNEVWSFGDEAYAIIRDLLHLRERLKPYILAQMAAAADTGTPPMRPLFFDFPNDPGCCTVEDQYMFGPDILVAPVLEQGATSRRVYLPALVGAGSPRPRPGDDAATGAGEPRPYWYNAWTGEAHAGGVTLTAVAPLARIPVYVRDQALLALFRS